MKFLLSAVLVAGSLISSSAWPQPAAGSLDVHWDEGAEDCKASTQPPIQVHAYNAQTFILRENLCVTFEAPFMYLLIGSTKALLIDSGDVVDAKQPALAESVMQLLPGEGAAKMPLIVAHTHRHLDHRAGDSQFEHLPNVRVVGFELDKVKQYFGFTDWPNGVAQIDLGDRTVDVLPTPGHNETHIGLYDRNTGLFFSGDFLMPGRLLIDDTEADLASAKRVVDFVKDRPVSHVLGGHIEFDVAGEPFEWQSQHHPREHALQLTKNDLLALPQAIGSFNGFYTRSGNFLLMNPTRNLVVVCVAALVILVAIVMGLRRYLRHRRRMRG